MLKIGLTGGIGSGKTLVANIFKVLGIPVFDADREAKLLMENNADLATAIKEEFGLESYLDGKLNRAFIANIVFNDPVRVKKLNALVHPAAILAGEKWMLAQQSPYIIKEAALLFESGSAKNLDFVIGVSSPLAMRIQRAMARDNTTEAQVMARISKQMNEETKLSLCNFIVTNDETHLLIPQVLKLHEKFLATKLSA